MEKEMEKDKLKVVTLVDRPAEAQAEMVEILEQWLMMARSGELRAMGVMGVTRVVGEGQTDGCVYRWHRGVRGESFELLAGMELMKAAYIRDLGVGVGVHEDE